MKIYAFILFLVVPLLSFAQISINEVCSSNKSILLDEFNESSDWIELYNSSNMTIELEGLFLSDDTGNLKKWAFPELSISANDFLLLFASDEDLCDINCHTNFKLSSAGEILTLSDSNGNIISQMDIPKLQEDESFGKKSETALEDVYFEIPTPGGSNNNGSAYEINLPPTFITAEQFFPESETIQLTCSDITCEIFYTLDGSDPSNQSILYENGIVLDTTSLISAVAYSTDKRPSQINRKTYFIGSEHSLPIMSISSEPDNFWDFETGIFEFGPDSDTIYPYYGANFWKDTEIPLHIEYYINERLVFEDEVGTKIHGGKAARNNKMKALRFVTDGEYSSDGMAFPFFSNKNISSFRRIVLRNASGDYNYTHFRDAYLHRYFINEDLNLDVLADQPIVCYINGQYWGVMHIREKIDRFYLRENYGLKTSEIDLLEEDLFIIEGDSVEYLEDYDFIVNNDLSDPNLYEIAKTKFDVSSLIDFWIVQSFINNTDFPENNIKFWQPNEEGGKWRYLLFDMDVGMGRHGWTKANKDNFSRKLENEEDNKFINILLSFYKNKSFKEEFINRYCDLMNTTFREEIFLEETERTAAELDSEMPRHFNKWGWPGYDVWKNDRLPRIYSFIEERPAYQREFIKDYFQLDKEVNIQLNVYPPEAGYITINSIYLDQLPWNGFYYNDIPVNITVSENNGYTFSHWESLISEIPTVESKNININIEEDDEFTAFFSSEESELNFTALTNPIASKLKVSYILDRKSDVRIDLIDVSGKVIDSFQIGERNAGLQYENLRFSQLNLNHYFLRIITENKTETIKVIIGN